MTALDFTMTVSQDGTPMMPLLLLEPPKQLLKELSTYVSNHLSDI